MRFARHRAVTLGSGLVEDVDLTAALSGQVSVSEIYLNLWHNGFNIALLTVNSLLWSFDQPDSWVMTFDDEAVNGLPNLALTGSFKPLESLTAFDGLDAAGDWIVTIADFSGGDTHYLDSFTLRVTVSEPATLALLGVALAGLGFSRRRKMH